MLKNRKGQDLKIALIVTGIVAVVILVLVLWGTSDRFRNFYDFFRNLPSGNLTQPGVEDAGIIGYSLNDGELYFFTGREWILFSQDSIALGKNNFEKEETMKEFRDYIAGIKNYDGVRSEMEDNTRLTINSREELFSDQDDEFISGLPALSAKIETVRYGGNYYKKLFGATEGVEGVIGGRIYIEEGNIPILVGDPSDERRAAADFIYVPFTNSLYLQRIDEGGNYIEDEWTEFTSAKYGESVNLIKDLAEDYFNSVFGTEKIRLKEEEYEVERRDPYVFVRL